MTECHGYCHCMGIETKMVPLLYTLAFFGCSLFSLGSENTSLSAYTALNPRESRVFFLFPLFTPFRRKACLAGTSQSLRGVCYTSYQCGLRGGVASGSCANGRGVCCVFQYSCDGVSNAQNYTYFTSPNYPSSFSGGSRCTITVSKVSNLICQIRINMLDLSLAPPTADGICKNDFLSMSGFSIRLCGINKGQHMYVNFNTGTSFTLSVDTNSALSYDRTWNLEIIQIPCSSGVPGGCTQFFNSTSGSVSSFNYDPTASTSVNTADGSPGNRQITGLSYGICVKHVSGYCAIEWSQSSSSQYTFTVSGPTDTLNSTLLGSSTAAATGPNCTTNFVVIPNPSQNGVKVPYDRFCGNGFVTTSTSASPYVLYVVSAAAGSSNSTNMGNRGFNLNYRLLPC